jgi:hypothetical protein
MRGAIGLTAARRGVAVAGALRRPAAAERLGQVVGGHRLAEQAGRHDRALAQQHGVGEAGRDLLDVVGDQHHGRRVGSWPAR